MKNYVIWGKAPNTKEEVLLLEKFDGRYVTDKVVANNILKLLTDRGCFDARVQEVNLEDSQMNKLFADAINV